MRKFEIGKYYDWGERNRFDPILVLSRTAKTIVVRNRTATWRMLIRKDENGNEYVVDSSFPKSYKNSGMIRAEWETASVNYPRAGGSL